MYMSWGLFWLCCLTAQSEGLEEPDQRIGKPWMSGMFLGKLVMFNNDNVNTAFVCMH